MIWVIQNSEFAGGRFSRISFSTIDVHRDSRENGRGRDVESKVEIKGGRGEGGKKGSPSFPLLVSRGHPVRIRGIALSRGGHENWEGGHTREKYEI